MNAAIRGRAAIWGIETTAGDTFGAGIILSQKQAKNADTDDCRDGEGFIISEVFFNQNDECDIEIAAESGTTLPEPGDDINIAGVACIVQPSPTVTWNQKGWKGISIKAKHFENLVEV